MAVRRDEEGETAATVYIPIPPLRRRLVVLGLVSAAVTAMVVSAYEATWFSADLDGRKIQIGLWQLWDEPGLTRTGGTMEMIVLVVLTLAGAHFVLRLGYMGFTVAIARPLVRRGWSRSRLLVAWMKAWEAHLHAAAVFVAGLLATWSKPTLSGSDGEGPLPALVTRSWGGYLLLGGVLLGWLAVAIVDRDGELAATQCWELFPTPRTAAGNRPSVPKERGRPPVERIRT